MIEKLTKDQEAKLETYKDKWLKIGLDTSPIEKRKVRKIIGEIYKASELEPPKKIIWAKSPMDAIKIACKETGDEDPISHINNFCYGSHEASWLSFYNYCAEVFKLDCCDPLTPSMELAKYCGWWLPYDNLAILSEKPCEIHINEANVLHKDGGPAIKYSDGFAIWALNGVRVPQEIAETPWDKLDPHLVVTEKNAEIRRELVRKIGVERIMDKLNVEVIDKQDDYELVNLEVGDNRLRPYLKMLNPSLGVWHVEGVPREIKTVEAALEWRNGTAEKPEVLT